MLRIPFRNASRLATAVFLVALLTMSACSSAVVTETGAGEAVARVQPGVEVLLQSRLDLVAGKRVGLITNMTGIDSKGTHIADLLQASPGVELAAFFAPEHGLRGDRAAGDRIASYVDPATGLPVHSLYGSTLKPTADMLAGVDVLIFDIQDVGTRFYTYIYTMAYAMEAAAKFGLPFIVLDRPNPIGGIVVEGPILEPEQSSFIGLYPIALRHGMTVGELAAYFNGEYGFGTDLTVVPMTGWQRRMWFDDTGLPWVPPSPNMVTLATATVYPGMGLIEGTNVSEGRGTLKPFEMIGAPWVDGSRLARHLNDQEIPGARFHPAIFTPTTSKHQDMRSEGVTVQVTDREQFESVATGLHVVLALRTLYPDQFAWRPPSGGRYFFDQLSGTKNVRLLIDAKAPVPNMKRVWQSDLDEFLSRRAQYLLYD